MSFLDIFAYTVVISRETVKSPKNTLFDTCAQNSWRYEFSDIFAHTVVIRSKNVKKTHISASSRHKYHKSCS